MLANTFLAAPQKRRQGVPENLPPEGADFERGAGGDGNNIGNIVSLCLTPGNSSLAADFCFQPGAGW